LLFAAIGAIALVIHLMALRLALYVAREPPQRCAA
jgi:hypothetical protein